jgi:hypothetical protein
VIPVTGDVFSNYKLTNVTASIVAVDGKNAGKAAYTATVNPNAWDFDLSGWQLSLRFDGLPQGKYTFTVTAKDASGKSATLQFVAFTVTKAAPPPPPGGGGPGGGATNGAMSSSEVEGIVRGFLSAVGFGDVAFKIAGGPQKIADSGEAVFKDKNGGIWKQCAALTAYYLELNNKSASGTGKDMAFTAGPGMSINGAAPNSIPIVGGIFSWGGDLAVNGHTGIVIGVDVGKSFTTLENNVSGELRIMVHEWKVRTDSSADGGSIYENENGPYTFTTDARK